jgi:hypothetical protein
VRAHSRVKIWIDNEISTAILPTAHLTNRQPLARRRMPQPALACRQHILLSHAPLHPCKMERTHSMRTDMATDCKNRAEPSLLVPILGVTG